MVITEDNVFSGPIIEKAGEKFQAWQEQLKSIGGFNPVIIGFGGKESQGKPVLTPGTEEYTLTATDTIGVVTIHDGPTIESGEIIAPSLSGKLSISPLAWLSFLFPPISSRTSIPRSRENSGLYPVASILALETM